MTIERLKRRDSRVARNAILRTRFGRRHGGVPYLRPNRIYLGCVEASRPPISRPFRGPAFSSAFTCFRPRDHVLYTCIKTQSPQPSIFQPMPTTTHHPPTPLARRADQNSARIISQNLADPHVSSTRRAVLAPRPANIGSTNRVLPAARQNFARLLPRLRR